MAEGRRFIGSFKRMAPIVGLSIVWLFTVSADWPTYLNDNGRSGASPDESGITPSNAALLQRLWTYRTGGAIAASPTVAGGVVYIGAWDGYEYAISATRGTLLWRTYLGITTGSPHCYSPSKLGITSSATVVNGTVYVGGGDSYWYALDPATGAVRWRIYTGDNSAASGHYNWSSPLIVRSYAYIGVASLGDCPLVRGQLLKVNVDTHRVVGAFNVVPPGSVGGGIWTSPTYDPTTNSIFVTTGTQGNASQRYVRAILAIDPDSLAVKSYWQVPASAAVPDSDWGTTPILFKDSAARTYVAAVNKNGRLYAFTVGNLTAGPVWTASVAIGGSCPTCSGGSVSSGAFNGAKLFFAGGRTVISGKGYLGSVRAIDPSTGSFIWEHGSPAPVIPAVAYANGFVVDAAGAYIELLDATNGNRLYSERLSSTFYGPPIVANGVIYIGSGDGSVLALIPRSLTGVPGDSNCPTGWGCQDIGAPALSGSESAEGSGLTVSTASAGVRGGYDQFRFISTAMSGDSQIAAQVVSINQSSSAAQAGILVRQRPGPFSPYYAAYVTPTNLVVGVRSVFGGAPNILYVLPRPSLPLFLEIQRNGDLFQAATSVDGLTFSLIPGSLFKVVLPYSVLAGTMTASGVAGTMGGATYSRISVGSGTNAAEPAASLHACPPGWTCQDIGDPYLVGDQLLTSGGWTLNGSNAGSDTYMDRFHFVWQAKTADTAISARVVSQTAVGPDAGAGVMIRQSTDPAAVYFAASLNPISGVVVQVRTIEGLFTTSLMTGSRTSPLYLRVTRSAETFCASTSNDGIAWTNLTGSCTELSMSPGVLVGMAVGANSYTISNEASFDHVAISGAASGT